MGVAPRKPLGGGGWDIVPNLGSGYCAMQNVGIWAIAQLREGAPNFKYGIFKLPTPARRQVRDDRRRLGLRRQRQGRESQGRRRVLRLGARLDEARTRSSASSIGAPRPRATCRRANPRSRPARRRSTTGFLKVFADEIYPGARAEPRMPPQVYKAISDAIQACQLNGAEAGGRGRRGVRSRSTRSSRATRARRSSEARDGAGVRNLERADRRGAPSRRRALAAIARANGSRAISSSLPDALGLLIFVGGADAAVAEPRLLLGQRLRRVSPSSASTITAACSAIRCSGRACSVTLLYIVAAGARALCRRASASPCWCSATRASTAFVRSLLFMPQTVSLVVVALVWQVLLVDKIGLLNRFAVVARHRPASPGSAIRASRSSRSSSISVWFLMGFYMLIFLGGLQDIPKEYYEAARIDGARAVASFFTITLPLLRPTSFFVLLVSTVTAVCGSQTFDLIYVMTQGRSRRTRRRSRSSTSISRRSCTTNTATPPRWPRCSSSC